MSIDGVNGVNVNTNASSLSETKAADEENNDKSLFETVADAAGDAWKAGVQDIKDDRAEAKEHFKNGEILKGLAKGAEAVAETGILPILVNGAIQNSKIDEES